MSLEVRLIADPSSPVTIHLFDLRQQFGIHLVVADVSDAAPVLALAEEMEIRRARTARVRRDGGSVFLEVDDGFTSMLGWSADELLGRPTLGLVHPEDAERAIAAWLAMRAGADNERMQVRFRHASGGYRWVEVCNENRLDDPDYECVLSEIVDISEQMAELEALHDREVLLGRLAEALPIGICHVRHDREVAYCNAPLLALLGPIDSTDALVRSVVALDRAETAKALTQALGGMPRDVEVSVMHGFEERRCELAMRPMVNDAGRTDGVILCCTDVTDRSRLRSELEHRASHDALSGCLNRAATVSMLERALREWEHVTVAYVDLDDFKAVNDTLGHAAGDELLRVAAARLRSVIRSHDRIGRIGGDEFVVICPQGAGPFEGPVLVRRLKEAITGEVTFARQRIMLSASIGAASCRAGEVDAEKLLEQADAAMYEVKRRRRPGHMPLASVSPIQR